ncbi:MAG TPA: amidohydrolase family protein [Flavipsychrobacter sp.]|nr:amidohydrolase family protein [Flavipsychrobacter sp.]
MFLTADTIHDGKQFLESGTVLELNAEGTILALHHHVPEATHYEGILCPGFVNAHCHLELSHMKGVIPRHTGLIPFLQQVMKDRGNFTEAGKKEARTAAAEMLWEQGVSAIGDISNTTDCLDIRAKGKLQMHTFVEALGFNEVFAERSFDFAVNTYQAYAQQLNAGPNRQSITAHAPYSVSRKLFGLISDFDERSLLSIHNQECDAENQFYRDKTGAVNELLDSLHIDASGFQPSRRSSLQTYTEWIAGTHPVIFVHDTFTSKEDITFAMQRFEQVYFCLCPNANLYIENTLPDVRMFMEAGAHICIGTDSLASNDRLCMYSELQTLKQHFDVDWELLLQWACCNGARALQMENRVGRFLPGTQPGVVQIHQGVKRLI